MTNADTVRAIYAAFSRADGPAVLQHLADDIEWDFAYPADHAIPWLRRARGHAGAAAFFQAAAEHLDFQRLEIPYLVGEGRLVIALASLECTVKATGRVIRETEEPHVWHFDERGKVVRFRHAADTWQQWKALMG